MAIQMGKGGQTDISDINVTPMIDVLLVLLVIFIVVQPMLQKSIDVQVPKEEENQNAEQIPKIVLEIAADGSMAINTQPVPNDGLQQRLTEIFANRSDRVLFIKASEEVLFQDVIAAMDAARGAGVLVLGAVL